jgi:hypothetical protein
MGGKGKGKGKDDNLDKGMGKGKDKHMDKEKADALMAGNGKGKPAKDEGNERLSKWIDESNAEYRLSQEYQRLS